MKKLLLLLLLLAGDVVGDVVETGSCSAFFLLRLEVSLGTNLVVSRNLPDLAGDDTSGVWMSAAACDWCCVPRGRCCCC